MRTKFGGLILLLCLIAITVFASHGIEYRWESPRVTMTLSDVVGTPIPPSYGFWANMDDLGHKFRIAQGFMEVADSGLIGEKLNIHVTIYGLGYDIGKDAPSEMTLEGERSSALILPPFTNERFVYALNHMTFQEKTIVPEVLADEDEELTYGTLSDFPDEGFAVFSPNGKQIAFRSWRESSVDIYTKPVEKDTQRRLGATMTSEPPQLAYANSVFGLPQWSPDGKKVAYIADGRPAVANLASSAVFLDGPEKAVADIKWSPDGKRLLAVVSAQEDNINVAGDIMILDPSRTSQAVSLEQHLDIFEHGFFEAKTLWSPNSSKIAAAFNLNGIHMTLNNNQFGEAQAIIYVVKADSLETQTVPLDGTVQDWAWSDDSTPLMVVSKIDDEYFLKSVDTQNMQTKEHHTSFEEIIIAGMTKTHAVFLDGGDLLALDLVSNQMLEVTGFEIDKFDLPAGHYGGFLGVDSETITQDEPGTSVITLKYHDGADLYGLKDSLIRKNSRILLIAKQGTIPDNLANLVGELKMVHFDWSPRTGLFAFTLIDEGPHNLMLMDFSVTRNFSRNNIGIQTWTGFVVILAIVVFLILVFRHKRLSGK